MNDNDKKSSRNRGPKSGGPRGGMRRSGSGTSKDGGKSGFPSKKPFTKRRDDASGAEKPARAFNKDFKRGSRPSRDGEDRASYGERRFGKASGGEAKPYRKRDDRPFDKREGDRKPFEKRRERPAGVEGERSAREFRGERKPFEKREGGSQRPGRFERAAQRSEGDAAVRAERADRPFRDGPRPERKPFVKRTDGDASERGERRFERTKRDFSSDGPKRTFGSGKPKRDFGSDRPERDFSERKPAGGFRSRPQAASTEVEGERIAKRLARAGIASRRDAEELIAAGRVKVNGEVLSSPAFNVMPSDVIHLDGTEIPPIERTRLFLFHKPAGVVTTNRDPEGRKTVFDVLPAELPRLMTIGRLDINTEGLLLLTNDGGLSRVLELPATGWLRRYRVRVHGKVEEKALADLRDGVAVGGVFYGAVEASLDREQGSNAWLTIGLREGKNREVKNILGSLGLDVTRLIRVSYGPFQLGELPEGHVLEIKGRMLRDQLGERLIEESGANFEADIVKPFSNRPTRRTEPVAEESPRPKFQRDGVRGAIGEGGLIKNRKRREGSRDEALGKLSTRPDGFGEKRARPERSGFVEKAGRGKKPEREQKPLDPPGQRKANVWMAPGARPAGKARQEADDAALEARKDSKPAFKGPRREGGRQDGGDRPRFKGPGKGPKRT